VGYGLEMNFDPVSENGMGFFYSIEIMSIGKGSIRRKGGE